MTSLAGGYFASLGEIGTGLGIASAGQQGGGTTAKAVLLDALRLDLQNIARTARAIAQDTPGFADRFSPPANTGQGALTTAAIAYLAELKKPGVAAQFTAHELPAGFDEHLAADLAAIAAARDGQETSREAGVASTATVGTLIADGMRVANYLDAIMHNKYARVPDKLRAWQSASHIERPAQREKPAAPAAATVAMPARP